MIYERTFDDMTMGNYKILQAKLKEMSNDIDDLKQKYFEVKAPLTLESFECPECGATLEITSKEETFIVCKFCNVPILLEWQED